jgi:hypothetical protein
MHLPTLLKSQYLAALAMFEAALDACPDALWDSPKDNNRTWRVAFHTLFYTHLYLQHTEGDFQRWEKHRGEAQYLGRIEWDNNRLPMIAEAYTRAEIAEYLAFCCDEVTHRVGETDPDASSGFEWLHMNKLELHFYNIRHIQQHTGELYERVGAHTEAALPWVGQWPDEWPDE